MFSNRAIFILLHIFPVFSFHETNVASFSRSTFHVMDQKPFTGKEEQDDFTCCAECVSNYEKEAGFNSIQYETSLQYPNSCNTKDIDLSSNELPYWLKQEERNVSEKDSTAGLKSKWNKLCQRLHQGRYDRNHARSEPRNQCSLGNNNSYSSYPPLPRYSSMFLDNKLISFGHNKLKTNQSVNLVPRFRRQQSCHIDFNFGSGNSERTGVLNLDSPKCKEDENLKITLALGNSSVSDSVICSEKLRKESVMRNLLQENVPWQSVSIPIIVEALMNSKEAKKDTWFLIEGNDLIGKRRMALGITELLLGSADFLIYINLKMKEDIPRKNCEMLKDALGNHGRLVVLLEDVDFSDAEFLEFLADGFKAGRMGTLCKKEGTTSHPVFILTKSGSTSYRKDRAEIDTVIQMELLITERTTGSGTFYADHKRKVDWDMTNKNKFPRKDETENACKIQLGNGQREFSYQLSSNTLDLNMTVVEEEGADETKEFSLVSSDLTSNDQQNYCGFLDMIKNHFVFNRDSAQDTQLGEMFLSMIRGSFGEAFGTNNLDYFSVEQSVLEEISVACGTFLHSLFEKWLKDIFQTSLKRANIGMKEGINVRLCIRGNGKSEMDNGFEGSCLPKDVPIAD